MVRLFVLLLVFSFTSLWAQEEHAWVFFKEKTQVQEYLSNPSLMLTQRALERRTKQGIPLDFTDVPITPSNLTTIQNAQGITYKAKSKWMNAVHVLGTQANIEALKNLAIVDHVEFANDALNIGGAPTSLSHAMQIPIDKLAVEMTKANFIYGGAANQIQMFNGHKLHERDYTGQGMLIAVLDAGFPTVDVNPGFQRLRDNNQIKGGYDFVGRSDNFYTKHYHGTVVLSDIGGYLEGQFVGTAPDADFYLFITEDAASETPVEESYWVEAAEEADRLGVDVINTSLGYTRYDNANYNYDYNTDLDGKTSFISRGAAMAFTKGMVLVNSGGNSGGDASWGGRIGMPADVENVLSIGAVNASGSYAGFSSKGPTSDNRLKPDVMAQGQAALVINTSGGVSTINGTSFSSPILAGGITCLWQALPNYTNAQLIQLVRESASIYATPNYTMGYGIPDLDSALNKGLSVSEQSIGSFTISPNPTQGDVELNFPFGMHQATITLYNVLGQRIMEEKLLSGSNTIPMNNLKSGLYLLKIKASGIEQIVKIIKE